MFFRRPKVSVIIPVYNVQDYLRACLDSVVNQTLCELEIICIDDGSTDNSAEILREYAAKDKRIKIISQKNKGVAAARNQGLKIARGEYVGFVDSDDWIDLNYYENLYTEARRQKADLVMTTHKYGTPENEKESGYNKVIYRKKSRNEVLNKYSVTLTNWDKIYRLDNLRQHQIDYYDDLIYGSDAPFTVRAFFFSQKSVFSTGTFYHYRKNRTVQLTVLSLARIKDERKAYQIIFDFINSVEFASPAEYLQSFVYYFSFINQVFWRNKNGLKEFTELKQILFLKHIIKIYHGCKYPEQLKQLHPSSLYECLDTEDYAKYQIYQKQQEKNLILNKLTKYSAARIRQI